MGLHGIDLHRRESFKRENNISEAEMQRREVEAALEAEHYDSSPSPGSCYDTTSESVQPGLIVVEPMSRLLLENTVSQAFASSFSSRPSTWPEASATTNAWQEASGTRCRRSNTLVKIRYPSATK